MIIDKIEKFLLAQKKRTKKNFWASDAYKCNRALWYSLNGVPESNPASAQKKQRFVAGTAFEKAYVQILDQMGMLVAGDVKGKEQERIDLDFDGLKVSGYIDAILRARVKIRAKSKFFGDITEGITNNIILEIKTYYGSYAEKDFSDRKVKDNHLAQIAFYMYARKAPIGILLYIDITGKVAPHEFIVRHKKDMIYTCENQKVNLQDIINHWKEIGKEQPKPDYTYKYPLTAKLIKETSAAKISKARTGRAVIGDWMCNYCQYKNLCLKEQGISLGYTKEEKEKLMKLTKGYTSRGKKIAKK